MVGVTKLGDWEEALNGLVGMIKPKTADLFANCYRLVSGKEKMDRVGRTDMTHSGSFSGRELDVGLAHIELLEPRQQAHDLEFLHVHLLQLPLEPSIHVLRGRACSCLLHSVPLQCGGC